MKIGILGTGMVGQTLGTKLVQLGHQVKMGSRSADNPKAIDWMKNVGSGASKGTFAEAAAFGEIIFNCTAGTASLAALELAGAANLKGKILIDVSNPLDFSQGRPPFLSVCNTDSIGEQIQRTYPDTRVVKSLNTMNCSVMINPGLLKGDHDVFVSGNDPDAKAMVTQLLKEQFGWKSVIDLGDITTARGAEMVLPLWLALRGVVQTSQFNFKVVTH
jgi:predicted dinucleotide-binding enzyme